MAAKFFLRAPGPVAGPERPAPEVGSRKNSETPQPAPSAAPSAAQHPQKHTDVPVEGPARKKKRASALPSPLPGVDCVARGSREQLTACALVCRVVRRAALTAAASALSLLTLMPGGAGGAVGGSRRSGMCLFPAGRAPGGPCRDVRPCACGLLRLRGGGVEGDPGRNGGGERAERPTRLPGCWAQDGNGTNATNGGTGVSACAWERLRLFISPQSFRIVPHEPRVCVHAYPRVWGVNACTAVRRKLDL